MEPRQLNTQGQHARFFFFFAQKKKENIKRLPVRLTADPVFAGYIPPGQRLLNYSEAAVVVLEGRGRCASSCK